MKRAPVAIVVALLVVATALVFNKDVVSAIRREQKESGELLAALRPGRIRRALQRTKQASSAAKKARSSAPKNPATGATARSGNLLFKSGFEEPVSLEPPKFTTEWVQYLRGGDQGYEWATELPDDPRRDGYFTFLIGKKSDPSKFVANRLETVTGHDGKPTRALYMEFIKDDPASNDNTRTMYSLFPGPNDTQGYVRYWLKLQPNLEQIMPPGVSSFRQVMEWKESGPPGKRADYRWNIYLRRSSAKGARIVWMVRSEFGDQNGSPVDWEYKSDAPVPIGEWFLFEVFWKQHETDGRVWAAVNGQTIVDHRGRTKKDSGVGVWWPFKVYVGGDREITKRGTLYQWIDDVEFYRDIP
jgi:hypothetical protein